MLHVSPTLGFRRDRKLASGLSFFQLLCFRDDPCRLKVKCGQVHKSQLVAKTCITQFSNFYLIHILTCSNYKLHIFTYLYVSLHIFTYLLNFVILPTFFIFIRCLRAHKFLQLRKQKYLGLIHNFFISTVTPFFSSSKMFTKISSTNLQSLVNKSVEGAEPPSHQHLSLSTK